MDFISLPISRLVELLTAGQSRQAGGVSCPPVLRNLPPFPAIASRLLRIVAQEDFSYREVSDLVRSDPAFSAEVLRLANSSLLNLRYEIRDIPHAVAVMGVHRLRGIILTLAMKDFLLSSRRKDTLTRGWRHSLATALVTELIAEAAWLDKGLGYTAGLLHDIGALTFLSIDDGAYSSLVGELADAGVLKRREIESFGIDHCEAGKWLLEDWELPSEFQDVAARHHDVPERGCFSLPALVYIGSTTADLAGFPVCGAMHTWDPSWTLSWFDRPILDRVRSRIEELPLVVATKINSFDCDFLT